MHFNPADILLQYACLLFSLCFHEAAHAFVADRCGDPSARFMGRISLNPLVHIDPIGTVVMPLLMMTFLSSSMLFGWAKPVPFNPRNLHNVRRDPVLIALAGPVSNILLAVVAMTILRVVVVATGMDTPEVLFMSIPGKIAFSFIMINLILALFNIIPVPPLDGHYLLHYFLPPSGQRLLENIGPFGILIAILLVQRLDILSVPFSILMTGVFHFVFWA